MMQSINNDDFFTGRACSTSVSGNTYGLDVVSRWSFAWALCAGLRHIVVRFFGQWHRKLWGVHCTLRDHQMAIGQKPGTPVNTQKPQQKRQEQEGNHPLLGFYPFPWSEVGPPQRKSVHFGDGYGPREIGPTPWEFWCPAQCTRLDKKMMLFKTNAPLSRGFFFLSEAGTRYELLTLSLVFGGWTDNHNDFCSNGIQVTTTSFSSTACSASAHLALSSIWPPVNWQLRRGQQSHLQSAQKSVHPFEPTKEGEVLRRLDAWSFARHLALDGPLGFLATYC